MALPRFLLLAVAASVAAASLQAQIGVADGTGGPLNQSEEDGGVGAQGPEYDFPDKALPIERPILLRGEVLMASGEVPPEPIRINRVCRGETSMEGYTDSKGQFSFRLENASTDASVAASSRGTSDVGLSAGRINGGGRSGLGRSANSMRGIDLTGCSLEAVAPGYRSDPILLGLIRGMDNSSLGTIVLTPIEGAQAVAVSATSLAAPKKARALLEKASKELAKGSSANLRKAIRQLEEAVAIYPDYAAALSALGQAQLRDGDLDGARESLNAATEIDARYLGPYEPLIQLSIATRDWERAEQLIDVVLSAEPASITMRWYRAIARYETQQHAEAIALLDEIQSDAAGARAFPQTHHIRGLILAKEGKFADAADEYRIYLEMAPTARTAEDVRRQLYEWDQLGVI